ncbi:hypothetical protein Q4598_19090 [Phaeobacter inhibens]|uniref:hypothetical protein n=1 Tax=Phaeobacter inhibens TaxID=221822 RepID=UPI0026E2FF18|nr:hypothetical protein [Phaeobacter inhibens]MDO6758349.1 hypothetical protein [Phaeobacter inhibens]
MSDLELFTKAMHGAAELVDRYGEEFLPAFIAMEEQVRIAQQQSTAMSRALATAKEMAAKSRRSKSNQR